MSDPQFFYNDGRRISGTAQKVGAFPPWVSDNIKNKIKQLMKNGVFQHKNLPQAWRFVEGTKHKYTILLYVTEGPFKQIEADIGIFGPYTKRTSKSTAEKWGLPIEKVMEIQRIFLLRIEHYVFNEYYSLSMARQAVRVDADEGFKKGLFPLAMAIIDSLTDFMKVPLSSPVKRGVPKAIRKGPQVRKTISDGVQELKIAPAKFGNLFEHPDHVKKFFPNWLTLDARNAKNIRKLPFKIYDYLADPSNPKSSEIISVAASSSHNITYLFRKFGDLFGNRIYTFGRMKKDLAKLQMNGTIEFKKALDHQAWEWNLLERSKLCIPREKVRPLKAKIREYYEGFTDEAIELVHSYDDGSKDAYYDFLMDMSQTQREDFILSRIIGMDIDWRIMADLAK